MIKYVYVMCVALVVSVFFNIYIIVNKSEFRISNLSKEEGIYILKKLIMLSNSRISKNNCEIYKDNKMVKHPTILDAFNIAAFFESNGFGSLECNDNICYLNIGIEKPYESSSRILRFKYNKEYRSIDVDSFECADIP